MTQKTCVALHVCDFYFTVTICDLTLTLTFRKYALRTCSILCGHLSSTLGEFDLFAALLTDPIAQSVKALYYDL